MTGMVRVRLINILCMIFPFIPCLIYKKNIINRNKIYFNNPCNLIEFVFNSQLEDNQDII